MLASIVTSQLVFDGVVAGLVYGLLACGIVLVYRATRVINFAVGNMGLVGTGLFVLLAVQYGVPYWLAAIAGLLVGTLYGALIHLIVIRRLFDAPRVIVLVATIGIAQLSLAILAAYPKIDVRAARFPQAIRSVHEIASVRITGAQLSIVIVVPLAAIVLAWFLTRTTFGKSVKASAENRDLARLNGISPKQVSMFVWAAAGALATLSISLIAAEAGSAQNIALLGSSTLVRALAAAVIGGMVSFNRAFFAGIAIGVAEFVIAFNFPDQAGLVDFLILIGILIAVYFQSRQGSGETQSFSFTPKRRPIPDRLEARLVGAQRRPGRPGGAADRSDRAAAHRDPDVAPPAVHDGAGVRLLRHVPDDPDRVGRTALARADGLRRDRRAARRRVPPGHPPRRRLGGHPPDPRGVEAPARSACPSLWRRCSPPRSRRSSVSAPCACGASCWP